MLPIMVGVMMACYGDMGTFGLVGVVVTVFCVVMSGMKNVLSGEMLTGDIKVHTRAARKKGRRASVAAAVTHGPSKPMLWVHTPCVCVCVCVFFSVLSSDACLPGRKICVATFVVSLM